MVDKRRVVIGLAKECMWNVSALVFWKKFSCSVAKAQWIYLVSNWLCIAFLSLKKKYNKQLLIKILA